MGHAHFWLYVCLPGNPLSILDGVFMAITDDIDCYTHPTKGATSWLHDERQVRDDASCVASLRQCGVIFVGKANMHELGMGTAGNNPNHVRASSWMRSGVPNFCHNSTKESSY